MYLFLKDLAKVAAFLVAFALALALLGAVWDFLMGVLTLALLIVAAAAVTRWIRG